MIAKRARYSIVEDRIKIIVEGGFGLDGQRTLEEYLRGIAHNFVWIIKF